MRLVSIGQRRAASSILIEILGDEERQTAAERLGMTAADVSAITLHPSGVSREARKHSASAVLGTVLRSNSDECSCGRTRVRAC